MTVIMTSYKYVVVGEGVAAYAAVKELIEYKANATAGQNLILLLSTSGNLAGRVHMQSGMRVLFPSVTESETNDNETIRMFEYYNKNNVSVEVCSRVSKLDGVNSWIEVIIPGSKASGSKSWCVSYETLFLCLSNVSSSNPWSEHLSSGVYDNVFEMGISRSLIADECETESPQESVSPSGPPRGERLREDVTESWDRLRKYVNNIKALKAATNASSGVRCVVIGSGYTAIELVSALHSLKVDHISLLSPEPRLVEKFFGVKAPECGGYFEKRLEKEGVDIKLSAVVHSVEKKGGDGGSQSVHQITVTVPTMFSTCNEVLKDVDVVAIAGHMMPQTWFLRSGTTGIEIDDLQYAKVDHNFQLGQNIYAFGDSTVMRDGMRSLQNDIHLQQEGAAKAVKHCLAIKDDVEMKDVSWENSTNKYSDKYSDIEWQFWGCIEEAGADAIVSILNASEIANGGFDWLNSTSTVEVCAWYLTWAKPLPIATTHPDGSPMAPEEISKTPTDFLITALCGFIFCENRYGEAVIPDPRFWEKTKEKLGTILSTRVQWYDQRAERKWLN